MEALSTPTIRLAVLPHEISAERGEGYFIRGFVEDLITDLSRFPNLGLIASHSSFADKLHGLSDDQISEELGADFVLKAGIRKQGDALRLSAQLVNPPTSEVLWAERFDTSTEEVFEIQDGIVEQVTSALSLQIDSARLQAARRKPMTDLAAYDCWLRGYDRLREGTLEADQEAREYFGRALEIDSQFARAFAGLSLTYFNEWSCQLWERSEISECMAFENAYTAYKLDQHDPVTHLVLGRVYLYRRLFDRAEVHLDQALALNPNDADSLVQIGSCFSFLGRAKDGVSLYDRAARLNPYHEPWYFAYGGFNHCMMRQHEECLALALRSPLTTVWVDLSAYIALTYAQQGDQEKASRYLGTFLESFQQKILNGRSPEKGEAMDWLKLVNPFKEQSDQDYIVEGLQRAGLSADEKTTNRFAVQASGHSRPRMRISSLRKTRCAESPSPVKRPFFLKSKASKILRHF